MSQKGLTPILILVLIAVAIGGYFVYQNQTKPIPLSQQTTQPPSTPATNDESPSVAQNNISIQALNEGIRLKNLNSQNYTIEGSVININDCSCPEGVACLACLPEILVSENKQGTNVESKTTIYIRINNPKDFQIGKKYRFSILLPLDREKQGFSYERRLVEYELIK